MCSKPDIPEPTEYQASKAPVFNSRSENRSKTGRQGTLLATSNPGAGQEYAPGGKKVLLGQ